jgi:hypothetical protein
MFQTKDVEKIKTYFVFNKVLRKSWHLRDNVGGKVRMRQTADDSATRRMRFTLWISKAIQTHTEYEIFLAFLQQKLIRKCPTILGLYVQYSTVQYSTVLYSRVQYSTVLYSVVEYSTVQYSTVQYSAIQYSAVQCSTVQYSTEQCSTVQYSRVQ